jgi:hypothetical protein
MYVTIVRIKWEALRNIFALADAEGAPDFFGNGNLDVDAVVIKQHWNRTAPYNYFESRLSNLQ